MFQMSALISESLCNGEDVNVVNDNLHPHLLEEREVLEI